jgi:hypothetical protein
MKRSFHALTVLTLCAGIFLSSFAGADEADPLRAALRPEWLQFEADHRISGDDRLVVLIGENHASIRGQIHLAALLEQLLDGKLIDAILVEGSEGPVDIRAFDAEMVKLLPRDQLSGHWRRLLEWGQVSGWEYVVLTRPQIFAQGVEDMAAKTRFFITDLTGSDQDVQRKIASWERGAGRLEAAIAALDQAGLAQPKARLALDGYRKQLEEHASTARSFAEQRRPMVARQLEMLEAEEELEQLLKSTGLAELRGRKDVEVRFRQRMEQLVVEQPAEVERLSELIEKHQELEKKLRDLSDKIEPIAKALANHDEVAENAYFTLANQLCAAIEARWGREAATWPPEVAKTLGNLDSFFRDEAKRQREEGRALSRQQLAERDRAMAANTERYLRAGSAQRVVLIVGSAHLDGMKAELGALGLPFVSGRLLPEDSEPWEEEAWERRQQAAEEVFKSGTYKERSRLLDAVWREQQLAQARKGKLEAQGQERSLVRSPLLADQTMPRGSQVVAFGPVPGSSGEIYEIWDRSMSRDFVKKLSDGRMELVFGYHHRDAQGRLQYTLVSRQGDRSLEEFRKTPLGEKGQRPTYVVTFYEPDFQLQNDVPYSSLWQGLRQEVRQGPLLATGGGRGGGRIPADPQRPTADGSGDSEPDDTKGGRGGRNDDGGDRPGEGGGGDRKPPFWTAFGPIDPERPRMIRTYDPERARRNIDRILEQKPLESSEVGFFDDPLQLKDAYFAQRDGTYAGMVVLMAHNSAEFRAAVREAADGHKLVNKQVVLITCGDAFPETSSLRELLLSSGALMVWTPDRKITPMAGERLKAQIQTTLEESEQGEKPRDIDELTNRAIWRLLQAEPDNPDLLILRESGSWVALPAHAPLLEPDADEEERHA